MAKRFIVLLAAGLSSCSVQFNGRSTPPPANEGMVMIQPNEPSVWTAPCLVNTGTRFTAWLDRAVGTDSSRPGDPFTAHVTRSVVSSCRSDFILPGAVLRGRVTRSEPGAPPILALELIDIDTTLGPRAIPAAIQSGAGFAWVETKAPDGRSSYQALVLQPSWATDPSRSMAERRDLQLTFPAGGLIELELLETVLVLP